jgi:hypothetical protein
MWPVFLDLDILRISIDHSNCVERRRDAGVILDRFGGRVTPLSSAPYCSRPSKGLANLHYINGTCTRVPCARTMAATNGRNITTGLGRLNRAHLPLKRQFV